MRKLLDRKIVEQGRECALCHELFTDYHDVVPDHIDPKGLPSAPNEKVPVIQGGAGPCSLELTGFRPTGKTGCFFGMRLTDYIKSI